MFNLSIDTMFNRTRGNFSMKFPNGYTVSLAMGDGTYSSGSQPNGWSTVEIAAWDEKDNWVQLGENQDILGWVTTTDALAIMNKIAAL